MAIFCYAIVSNSCFVAMLVRCGVLFSLSVLLIHIHEYHLYKITWLVFSNGHFDHNICSFVYYIMLLVFDIMKDSLPKKEMKKKAKNNLVTNIFEQLK